MTSQCCPPLTGFGSPYLPRHRYLVHETAAAADSITVVTAKGGHLGVDSAMTLSVLGCRPGRWGRRLIITTMTAAMTAEANGRLRSRPPWLTGLSRKSPMVAPNGRVKMKATQKSMTRDTLVQ